jgi:hypothetical protein
MSSLVIFCLSSHYRIVLLPHYELVSPPASVGYVQTISNDVAQVFPRLVPPPVSHVCHRSEPDLFLCCHKSIVTCASQLRLVVGPPFLARLTLGLHEATPQVATACPPARPRREAVDRWKNRSVIP